jgi:hypothetical protein
MTMHKELLLLSTVGLSLWLPVCFANAADAQTLMNQASANIQAQYNSYYTPPAAVPAPPTVPKEEEEAHAKNKKNTPTSTPSNNWIKPNPWAPTSSPSTTPANNNAATDNASPTSSNSNNPQTNIFIPPSPNNNPSNNPSSGSVNIYK